ncbi:MAG: DNA mismatch repair endonuclease MutL [Bacteroidales bacterium]|nr:DNA mismatch repair endonuclease MutL [Bacteroidales bacterium]MDD3200802.1 DNA mismatch repair endonuclease MutL [Bacteroidales bacterium]
MLQILPSSISNLIAAGEVVGRPASVVKELLENAIDAGGKNISVIILDAGRTLIQVIDDGCGMTDEEAALCFERHSTSKIATAQDLERISTYGFRGEALASIAAVAEVTLKTRKQEEEIGTQVIISESGISSQEAVSTPVGSNFAIRNLFFNVPARRKFLKSDNAELRHIIAEFTRVAITRPGIAMRLTVNGKDIYSLRAVADAKHRIHDIFGREVINELVDVKTETSVVRITGYIGKPEDARKTLGNQFFFVNGRYFRSPYFHKAVCKPYDKLIPDGYTPTYFLFLETPFDKVDVNIHPAKTEVKFEDESMIFEILMACIREALGKNSFIPSIDFDTEGAVEIPSMSHKYDREGYIAPPKIDYDPLFNPFRESAFENAPKEPIIDRSEQYGILYEEQSAAVQNKILVIQKKYIVTPVKSGLLVINIRRANERILYERYLESVVEQQPITQQSLFPQTIKLSHEEYLIMIDSLSLTEKLGFDIRDFGNDSVIVYGLPDGFSADDEAVKIAVDALIASLKEDEYLSDNKPEIAANLAKSAAAGDKKALNQEEAQILVDQLFACRESSTAPDGRKCMSIITIEELEKRL